MHKNADLDALASAYYLGSVLGDFRIASDGMDRFAKSIARKFQIDVLDEADPEDYDEIITVDAASREQLGKFRDFRIDAVYDHHASNDIIADVRIVKTEYPSCAEMLYDLFGTIPDRTAGILLIGGIISDTRWFRHARTDTFRRVSKILEDAGIEYKEIAELFDFPYMHGEKIAILKGMQRLRFRTKGSKIVCSTIVGAHESSVAMLLVDVADVVFVASQKKGEVRITSRSREVDLLEILGDVSADFGCTYGGHRNAAGMQCFGDAEAILNALMIRAEKEL